MVGMTLDIHHYPRIPEFLEWQRFKGIVIVWLTFTALADIIIAVALVWYLVRSLFGSWEHVDLCHLVCTEEAQDRLRQYR